MALLSGPARRRVPGLVIEGHPKPSAAPIARLGLELAVELGPAPETLEGETALRGIAAHRSHPRGARTGRRRTRAHALEHGDGRRGIGPAEMEGRAQTHEPAAHDYD